MVCVCVYVRKREGEREHQRDRQTDIQTETEYRMVHQLNVLLQLVTELIIA